ncbi:MAG: alpha-L-fucosidase [Chitinophagaceae bacterium]
MRIRFLFCLLCFGFSIVVLAQSSTPLPSDRQLAWHELDYYLFMHFGPNTFYDQEWGHGTEDPNLFNPSQLDCRQWARIARDAGARGIIITAKHHDGFCLWPSQYSTHTVRESQWQAGKGDVLRDLSAACREYGILFGIYISPWDRNHPLYGTPDYNSIYVKTMQEAVQRYGPICEMWWDGANGEGPNGKKQVYDFNLFEKVIRQEAPGAVVFSDIGPDIRWVGNENGIAGETNWNFLDTAGFQRGAGGPPQDTLNTGNINGHHWIPAECDVSIRPGWFYHPQEDDKVKSPNELMSLYLKSVGRGANLLLNVPPDRRGLIHPHDSAALIQFRELRESFFRQNLAYGLPVNLTLNPKRSARTRLLTDGNAQTFWEGSPKQSSWTLEILLPTTQEINTLVLEEYLPRGQHIGSFSVYSSKAEAGEGEGVFQQVTQGTTIGKRRILQFPALQSRRLRVVITSSKGAPVLRECALYNVPVY